jgi:beta-lactamase class A
MKMDYSNEAGTARSLRFGAWCPGLSWSLVLGAWSFLLLSLAAMHAADPMAFAPRDEGLQAALEESVAATLQEFAPRKLSSNQLAVTVVNLRDGKPRMATVRGDVPIYPASVIKMFYLAAAHRWMEDGRLADTAEVRRAMRDMIVDSSNDATAYVVDVLTGTTGGPEMPDAEMKEWGAKRNAVNRYFVSLGHTNINANQKPWGDGPYGRERVWVGKDYKNRNALTTDATARLMTEIVLGRCITAARSREMLDLMKRDRGAKSNDADDQTFGFSGLGLPPEAKLWSKAGWTSTTRHDAAYVELPDGRKFIVVTFTTGHANERGIIAAVVRRVCGWRGL